MPTVDIVINGRNFTVQCGDGEELRVKRLANYLDARVREQANQYGQLGDARLLVLTSLLVADELDDALAEIKRLHTSLGEIKSHQDDEAARAIERVAVRLEQLASAIESA